MGEYLRPDVYVERVASGERPISAVGTSCGAFVGLAQRGKLNVAQLVTNWSEFIEKFAFGLDTPFASWSDLAYSVYGFFQNGGSRCYVVRTGDSAAAKAKVLIPVETGVTFTALDEGAWANSLKVTVTAGTGSNFDVEVKLGTVVVEIFKGLTNTATDATYYATSINGISKYITVEAGKSLVAGSGNLAGGDDGKTNLLDSDILESLTALDTVEINILAVPGETSTAVLKGILDYCSGRQDCFAILDSPVGQDVQAMVTLRADMTACDYGAIYYPWIKVVDPLATTNTLRLTPPSGHLAGLYARTDKTRGVYKAPAGTDAVISGAVELETALSDGDVEILNPLSVNCIMAKPNVGIVVWGARTLSSNSKRRYVSDVRFDIMVEVSCRKGTQWVVFEPNDEKLWSRIVASLGSFFFARWKEGQLKGVKKEQAYYIKCDAELNPQTIIDEGKVIAEVGYAKIRPGEFFILRIVQMENPDLK
jgi:phage tail sheath protein FI